MDHKSIHEYFMQQKEWLTDLLSGMVNIPSESGYETEVFDYMAEEMKKVGVDCELRPIDNSIKEHPNYSYPIRDLDYTGRSNLIMKVDSKNPGKVISLNSHLDVVPPSPGQEDPYKARVDENGLLWGRGSCDAKGQAAAIALLMKAAKDLGTESNSLVGHIVVEEEIGGNGTLAILKDEPDFTADAMINMEPTDLKISPSIRGAVWFDMTFPGVAGHAGSSKNTSSATDKAIGAVALLKQYHKDLLERSRDYGLFVGIENPMPLTIGMFQAGVWPSMVPGKARIAGVIGLLPNVTKDQVMQEIKDLFESDENRWISDGMTVDYVYHHNAVETAIDHPMTVGMQKACDACGSDSTLVPMTASTDAIFYQERGIPSLAFGPGRISDAHSCHEFVAVDDVIKAAEILYLFSQSY